ncbi:MAG: acetoacetate--CoA ligase [Rhodospirillales bacterium]|nr:acetoacetate--CoA ligase [Rhodospirillales bacterium]
MMSDEVLWRPSAEQVKTTQLWAFLRWAGDRRGRPFVSYGELCQWSIDRREDFWAAIWDFCGVIGSRGERVLVDDAMPGARWFPEARLNFAENLLRGPDDAEAVVFRDEVCPGERLTRAQLRRAVAQVAAALRAEGVGPGDRVAAWLPNVPATVVAMLATASMGAIFSSASPDFGVQGVLDRFGQIEPKVLFVCDGYRYNGRAIDCRDKAAEVVARLPGLARTVVVPCLGESLDNPAIPGAVRLDDLRAAHEGTGEIVFEPLPFDQPLYVLYSSGTTGIPKAIVHGAGATLLQHLKEHRLHGDVRPGDRLFYYTTCGWMMWNWLVSGLASEATLLLYDGAPLAADGAVLFDYAQAERTTHFGTSAKFIDAIAKAGLQPAVTHQLDALRVIFSTGSPLLAEGFDYVYRSIKADVQLASISGGTDIVSCFVLGNPLAPVRRGEIQCRGLGLAVEVFDAAGRPVRGEKGELVCTRAFPSMPVGFWNDPDGSRYHAAYFERFAGVWCHGDYAEITANDGLIIWGRSDATLNPGGVCIGTAEIYRQVEKLPEVVESLVIGQRWPPEEGGDERVVLFVRLVDGAILDDDLRARIRKMIRDNATPRHVPAKILQVADIPRTKSGKIVELAVRAVVHGQPVTNVEALANPEALAHFQHRDELSSA